MLQPEVDTLNDLMHSPVQSTRNEVKCLEKDVKGREMEHNVWWRGVCRTLQHYFGKFNLVGPLSDQIMQGTRIRIRGRVLVHGIPVVGLALARVHPLHCKSAAANCTSTILDAPTSRSRLGPFDSRNTTRRRKRRMRRPRNDIFFSCGNLIQSKHHHCTGSHK